MNLMLTFPREAFALRCKGDDKLTKAYMELPRNAKYHSSQIQNEIIQLIGTSITKKLVMEIKQAEFYSIIFDETTDVSNIEQILVICVSRYLAYLYARKV